MRVIRVRLCTPCHCRVRAFQVETVTNDSLPAPSPPISVENIDCVFSRQYCFASLAPNDAHTPPVDWAIVFQPGVCTNAVVIVGFVRFRPLNAVVVCEWWESTRFAAENFAKRNTKVVIARNAGCEVNSPHELRGAFGKKMRDGTKINRKVREDAGGRRVKFVSTVAE